MSQSQRPLIFETAIPGRARRAAAALAALLFTAAAPAAASEWKWSVTPYAWASDVGAELSVGERKVAEAEIPFTDLLEDIETVGMFHFEAQRGEHGAMLDVFDVVLLEPAQTVVVPGGAAKAFGLQAGSEASITSEIGMTILELGGTWDPAGDQEGFALLYGARVLDQRLEVDVEPTGGGDSQTVEVRDTLVDGMVGVRYVRRLSRRFSAQLRGDVSTGDTELTWSGQSALSYAFGDSGRYAIQAGYRYLEVDFRTEDAVDLDMTLSGFHAGMRASF